TVRKLAYAGAPMLAPLTEACVRAFRPDVFVNHYGSTEIYTFTVRPAVGAKPGCAGRAGPHSTIRVVAASAARRVGPRDAGGRAGGGGRRARGARPQLRGARRRLSGRRRSRVVQAPAARRLRARDPQDRLRQDLETPVARRPVRGDHTVAPGSRSMSEFLR